MSFLRLLCPLLLALALVAPARAVDTALPEYTKVSGVAGNLTSIGSDTLANLVTLWAERYKRLYPAVNIQIQAAGSATAPPALTEGTAGIGPMSRPMKDAEVQAFEQRFGYPPLAVPVAIDALALFVHQDNPLRQLTLEQVDAIFSSTRLCGGTRELRTWGDLGLTGDWAHRPLELFGRGSVSGTYGYFKDSALCKGDFRTRVNEQPGSASVVQAVSQSLGGLGYAGIGYRTASVHTLALAPAGQHDFVEDTPENARSGRYPLARYLYVYVNKVPGRPLNPLEGEFLRLILSRSGQEAVVKDGYIPLPPAVVAQALRTLDL